MSKVGEFFKGVRHEMRQTTWPSAKEMRKLTASVFVVVILFALFFFVSESIIVWLLSIL
jgi:preprotein translocase subunit SecE